MGNWTYAGHDDDPGFSALKGKIITKIEGAEQGSGEIIFHLFAHTKARLIYHEDCCATCSVEDICGDVSDLIGNPILLAEEVSNRENPEGVPVPEFQDSFTWTFYKLSTIRGSVTIRWYGDSNGYYSEEASFEWWDEEAS